MLSIRFALPYSVVSPASIPIMYRIVSLKTNHCVVKINMGLIEHSMCISTGIGPSAYRHCTWGVRKGIATLVCQTT